MSEQGLGMDIVNKLVDEGFAPIEAEMKMATKLEIDPDLLDLVDEIVATPFGKWASNRQSGGVIARLFTAEISIDSMLRGTGQVRLSNSSGDISRLVSLTDLD